ncbi:MAG: hypothetical protein IT183_06850 [Acidobacteria bacterium]|nr:hypothetical protein [Acidobacteriota bacterium]
MPAPMSLSHVIDLMAQAAANRQANEATIDNRPLTEDEKRALIDQMRAQIAARFCTEDRK